MRIPAPPGWPIVVSQPPWTMPSVYRLPVRWSAFHTRRENCSAIFELVPRPSGQVAGLASRLGGGGGGDGAAGVEQGGIGRHEQVRVTAVPARREQGPDRGVRGGQAD